MTIDEAVEAAAIASWEQSKAKMPFGQVSTKVRAVQLAYTRAAIVRFLQCVEPTEEAKLEGARSIRDTMHAPNFSLRAEKCWRAMSRKLAEEMGK